MMSQLSSPARGARLSVPFEIVADSIPCQALSLIVWGRSEVIRTSAVRASRSHRSRSMRAKVRARMPLMLPRRRSTGSRSEEHTSELQSLMRISYAVFCLKKKKVKNEEKKQLQYKIQ